MCHCKELVKSKLRIYLTVRLYDHSSGISTKGAAKAYSLADVKATTNYFKGNLRKEDLDPSIMEWARSGSQSC